MDSLPQSKSPSLLWLTRVILYCSVWTVVTTVEDVTSVQWHDAVQDQVEGSLSLFENVFSSVKGDDTWSWPETGTDQDSSSWGNDSSSGWGSSGRGNDSSSSWGNDSGSGWDSCSASYVGPTSSQPGCRACEVR